ncbi:hypothetical protein [Streptomyces sp. NPDC004629]|uniref:hypothetical protein n=1 Tax=Streptomyces sp. NPDC004629 TaxID=3364705 RepID=UPI0036A77480
MTDEGLRQWIVSDELCVLVERFTQLLPCSTRSPPYPPSSADRPGHRTDTLVADRRYDRNEYRRLLCGIRLVFHRLRIRSKRCDDIREVFPRRPHLSDQPPPHHFFVGALEHDSVIGRLSASLAATLVASR